MQKRYKKRSELTEKTNMGYPTLADELNIETVNDQLAKVPGFEHMLTYGSKKPRFIDGGGNETLRIESINESVSRITNGMQGLFEVRESKKKITETRNRDPDRLAVWYQSQGDLKAYVWSLSKNYDEYKIEIYDGETEKPVHKDIEKSLPAAKKNVFKFFSANESEG